MTTERLSLHIHPADKKEEPDAKEYRVNFCLYCEPGQINSEADHDRLWRKAFLETQRGGQKVEVQYETKYDLGYWRNLEGFAGRLTDGVHAPSKDRDIASENKDLKDRSLEETKRSMDLTASLGAEYFVLHLTPQDEFQDRNGQLERGIGSLEKLADHYKTMGYKFKFLLENLEYPKWPADGHESKNIMKNAKDIFNHLGISEKLGFCLDVGHLWHNLYSLLPEKGQSEFKEELSQYISEVSKIVPIEVVHLVGAYVERSGVDNEIHETHAFPGEKPVNFAGDWMDVDTVLSAIKKYSRSAEKSPVITIEAHDPDISKHINSCLEIKKRLE